MLKYIILPFETGNETRKLLITSILHSTGGVNQHNKARKKSIYICRDNQMLISIMVLHYKALCILTRSDLSHLNRRERQDKMVCQADFYSVLFPQIIIRDKLLN